MCDRFDHFFHVVLGGILLSPKKGNKKLSIRLPFFKKWEIVRLIFAFSVWLIYVSLVVGIYF